MSHFLMLNDKNVKSQIASKFRPNVIIEKNVIKRFDIDLSVLHISPNHEFLHQ